MLTKVAEEIGFNDFLLLSRGETKELGKARQYILANTFEAFVGALYLDLGYLAADTFIKKYVINNLLEIIKSGSHKDAKSHFQEQAQEKEGVTPLYKIMKERGPDHKKNFSVGVYLRETLIGERGGFSKQEPEEEAARVALIAKGCN